MRASKHEQTPTQPDSGTRRVAPPEHLYQFAMEGLGGSSESGDDNPVLSHLDAIANDIWVLQLACESTMSLEQRLDEILGRLVARVKVVRVLAAAQQGGAK